MVSNASAGSVTGYQKITWGISCGRYYVNGTHAFCAEYSKSWPTVGTEIVSITLCENDVIRKALYYGYNGPANTLGTDERAHVLTAIAISDANIGERETGASSKYDEFYWDIVNNPSQYPSPPNTFKAYLAKPSNSSMQTLAFYNLEKNGCVEASKTSKQPSVTDGNSCYSIEGAEYGIYSDSSLQTKVGTLVTSADGKTNRFELAPGTYYAVEEKAPRGYEKNTDVMSFQVKAEETLQLQLQDDPKMQDIELLIQKVDADSGENIPHRFGSLAGAQFEVKFYPGYWEEQVDPATLGETARWTWVFETNEKGEVHFEESFLISGDAIAEKLPMGTVTIKEVKASKGYLINENVYVIRITEEAFQTQTVKEEKIPPYRLDILKTDDYGNLLEGAEFTLYEDEACKIEVTKGTTDSEGKLVFQGLEVGGIYYLKETKAPTGYEVVDKEKSIKIMLDAYPENGVYELTVKNIPTIVLPETGTMKMLFIPGMGVVLCTIYTTIKIIEKRRKNL